MEIITRKEAKERGLKRYFTGKPCKQGHVAERFTGKGTCCTCNLNYTEKAIQKYPRLMADAQKKI